MIVKKEGRSNDKETACKKKPKPMKTTGSQTDIKIEEGIRCESQAKPKVKEKKRLAKKDSDWVNSKKKKVGSKSKKKACFENSVNVESHPDSQPLTEPEEKTKLLKKKKRKDKGLYFLPLENSQNCNPDLKNYTADNQENVFTGKEPRKNITQKSEGDRKVTKTKKKKKGKDIFSLTLNYNESSECHISSKKLQKKHINNSQERITSKKQRKGIVRNDESGNVIRKKKKKKKKDKHTSLLKLKGNVDNNLGTSKHNIPAGDLKNKQDISSQESIPGTERENIVQNSESNRDMTKKSKTISLPAGEANQDHSSSIPNKYLPRHQKDKFQDKVLTGKKRKKKFGDNSAIIKKKKKKLHKEEEEVTKCVSPSDVEKVASMGGKVTPVKSNKKKKPKTRAVEGAAMDGIDGGSCENNNVPYEGKKPKKRKKQGSETSAEEPSMKKKKKIKMKEEKTDSEAVESENDVAVVGERKGNCDEINIDKLRRQALQEEIDRESGKTMGFRSKVQSDTKFGQWSTAAFETSDEKAKFLRLMGGFKKGSASVQDPPAITEKPNMALSREGEEKLKQSLHMEFEKAMNLKHHRRVGLGFQPVGKKIYIDKCASRSIKFED